MNLRQLRQNTSLCEKLAAEYVLGTLRGAARRRFDAWLKEDASLQRVIADWQNRLNPLAEYAPSATPSPKVWDAIEKRLDLGVAHSMAHRASRVRNLFDNLNFWRNLGIVSTALATILVAILLTRQPEPIQPTFIATLADDKSQPVMIVTGDATRHRLTVKSIAPQTLAADKSLELWAVPKDGPPRSLGLVAADATVSLPLPDNATPQSAPVLAVSLEAKGGSPNPNAPSGPILFKGAWVSI